MSAIRSQNLSKRYGKRRGVEGINLDVAGGEVFGFLGPNGAGKTTTIRMLLDLIRPTAGQAWLLGEPVRGNTKLRGRIGYLPGELSLYDGLSGAELFAYFARLRGADSNYWRDLAERFGLEAHRPMRTLSKGNKQKIGLIQAFMSRPELLILDEPTSGLDPLLQQEFQKLVREAQGWGATVFLSSHVLAEVQALCNRVGIIRSGQMVAVQTVSELQRRALRHVRIRLNQPVPAGVWEAIPGLRDIKLNPHSLEATVQGSLDPLVKLAARYGVEDFISQEPSLEEIFLTYYNE
jgi:ABC-2 type transport system ATP-binding protein